MSTVRLAADAAGIQRAAAILRAGGLAAFPTETVYGLGANALDPVAVRRIFEAKGRPADDPLIVHLASVDWLERVAEPNDRAFTLAAAFWPGPLTLVLPRRPSVPLEVTAGLDTVAVRVPSHPIAHALLEACDLPLAAPSANLFSRPSPTRARHVLDDLDGRVDAVLDGGPTDVGVESTIVDVSKEAPRLLRPGGVPAEAIARVLGSPLQDPPPVRTGAQLAPGMLPTHYAPRTPLVLISGPPDVARDRLRAEVHAAVSGGRRVGVLALADDDLPHGAELQRVGSYDDPASVATTLFDALRTLDALHLDVLFARQLADPGVGLGRALADRLRRAAQREIVPQ
ncbi:MAG: threonylcarbamoyl-AMP synthase [Chloroflexi bacterium]|nr:threonylcarbamoyl-AMP synthase [Chloroflexota bacterium]